MAGDGGDDDLVVGDDADEGSLSTRGLWRSGHGRWDIENNGFNVLSTHWGLDHCFKHAPAAIVNFLLTSFIVYALLQSFWQAEPQAGGSRGPDADRPGAGAGPRRGRLPGAVGRVLGACPLRRAVIADPSPRIDPSSMAEEGMGGGSVCSPRGVAGWPRESGAGTTTPGRKAVKPARSRLSVGRGSSKAGELRNCCVPHGIID